MQQLSQPRLELGGALQDLLERAPVFLIDQEQTLIEQRLLGRRAGALEHELGEAFPAHLGRTPDDPFLLGRGAQTNPRATAARLMGVRGKHKRFPSKGLFVRCTNTSGIPM